MAEYPSRRILTFDFLIYRMAQACSARKSPIPKATFLEVSGRSIRRCSSSSEAAYLRFRLSASKVFERSTGNFSRAKFATEIPWHLRHAEYRLRGDVAIIRQQRSNDIDRAGTFLK